MVLAELGEQARPLLDRHALVVHTVTAAQHTHSTPTSLAFSCWISEAMALMTALLLATRFSWGRITTRAAAVAKWRAARVLSAEPVRPTQVSSSNSHG